MDNPLDLLEGNITDGYVCVTMTNKELEVMNNMVSAYKKHKHKRLNNILVRIPYTTFNQPGGYTNQTMYGTSYDFGSVIFEATDSYGITKYVFDSENIQVINVKSWTNLNIGKMLEFQIPFENITMPKNHPIRKSDVVYMMIPHRDCLMSTMECEVHTVHASMPYYSPCSQHIEVKLHQSLAVYVCVQLQWSYRHLPRA